MNHRSTHVQGRTDGDKRLDRCKGDSKTEVGGKQDHEGDNAVNMRIETEGRD